MKAIKAILFVLVGMLLGILLTAPRQPTRAALYWYHGVRDRDISVCFAGNAVSARPARVREIVGHIHHFEQVANIRFLTVTGTRAVDETAPGGDLAKLACPAPNLVEGKSYYAGDIRVALWHTDVPVNPPGFVPGIGCTQELVGSSWSNPPDELDAKRPCQYNLKLGDDDLDMETGLPTGTPWLNHSLHEFGHALGLAHEHARVDENAGCVPSSHDEYHIASSGYMTPYDKNSVMHYRFWPTDVPSCVQSGSNYSNDGLTAYDRLALHILYPEDNRVAEFVGKTVIRAGETLSLSSAWKARGANMSFVAHSFSWKLNGVTYSTTPDLNVILRTPGTYTLTLSYTDFLGRNYTYSGPVRVLSATDFDEQVVAPASANLPLLYPNHYISLLGAKLSLDSNLALAFGSASFTDTVVLDYVPQAVLDTGGLGAVGLPFALQATYLSDGKPAQIQPGKTYTMVVTYAPEQLPPGVDEEELMLFSWDVAPDPPPTGPSAWVREPTSMVDPAANTITAMPDHFSLWAVLAPAKVYLPVVFAEPSR